MSFACESQISDRQIRRYSIQNQDERVLYIQQLGDDLNSEMGLILPEDLVEQERIMGQLLDLGLYGKLVEILKLRNHS